MTILDEYTFQSIQQTREHELVTRLERRRQRAERLAQVHGSRLGAIAHLARAARR